MYIHLSRRMALASLLRFDGALPAQSFAGLLAWVPSPL
jgi:hypothetical protein